MTSSLTAERVRRDIDVVAHAGLGLDDFFAEAVDSLRRAVPIDAACVATFDPNTVMLTSARKYGDLLGQDHKDPEFRTPRIRPGRALGIPGTGGAQA